MKIVNWIRRIFGTLNLHSQLEENTKLLNEINWANIFNNTITDSTWLVNKSFSPGRWAIGYPLLYVLYRVLDNMNPKVILEFGLGQSSNMLYSYANYFKDVTTRTLENEPDWIYFYKNNINLPLNSQIVLVENIETRYNGINTLSIKDLDKVLQGIKFDFILVDAPYGSERYSRSQILSLLPDNINESNFCIIMDDYDRSGEKETCIELEKLFKKYEIAYYKTVYKGIKDFILYCSSNLLYLTTL